MEFRIPISPRCCLALCHARGDQCGSALTGTGVLRPAERSEPIGLSSGRCGRISTLWLMSVSATGGTSPLSGRVHAPTGVVGRSRLHLPDGNAPHTELMGACTALRARRHAQRESHSRSHGLLPRHAIVSIGYAAPAMGSTSTCRRKGPTPSSQRTTRLSLQRRFMHAGVSSVRWHCRADRDTLCTMREGDITADDASLPRYVTHDSDVDACCAVHCVVGCLCIVA